MKILFFGDLHFNGETNSGGLGIDYPQPVAGDPLLELIKLLNKRYKNEKISLLVFLGDYVNGKNSNDAKSAVFERIKKFVEKIEDECSCIFDDSSNIKNRIIFVDGNHDVSRDEYHHEKFEKAFGEYVTPFSEANGKGVREYGAPIFNYKQLDLLIACISTTENAGAHFSNNKMKELGDLVKPLETINEDNYKKIMELLEGQQNADIGTVTNSTIERFRDNLEIERKTKMVFSHHPLIPIQHAPAPHFDTVNGPDFFDAARAQGFTFFISGHLHEFYCFDIFSRSIKLPGATLISVPTFINPSNHAQRFVELDIYEDNDYICRLLSVNKIRYSIEEEAFATNGHHENIHNQDEHTLLDYEIQELVKNNIIKNASTERIQAASYDCALGLNYKKYDEDNKAWPDEVTSMKQEENENGPAKIFLEPGERILIYTHEEFDIPKDMLLQASPRASWIRRGISVDLSFFVEPGFKGPFCFPVTNNNKHTIEISAQDSIMSVVFRKLSGEVNRGWSERHPESMKRRNKKLDT